MSDLEYASEAEMLAHHFKMAAAIERIRDLHTRNQSDAYECGDGCCWSQAVDECAECRQEWPCDTILVLDGEQA